MKINVEKKLRKIVNGHAKGFSTIELIIVVVIAGIMMAVAIPRMGVVTSVDLYSTARQVRSDIRYTQELAMSKYRQTAINFTANSNTYTITSSGSSESKSLPDRSKATFNTTISFTFNSSGEPIGGGGTLTISSGGSNKQIMVSSITGRATIQ
jgi:prepilin-type N-terminal cleavage/methylation domain-containing protein